MNHEFPITIESRPLSVIQFEIETSRKRGSQRVFSRDRSVLRATFQREWRHEGQDLWPLCQLLDLRASGSRPAASSLPFEMRRSVWLDSTCRQVRSIQAVLHCNHAAAYIDTNSRRNDRALGRESHCPRLHDSSMYRLALPRPICR